MHLARLKLSEQNTPQSSPWASGSAGVALHLSLQQPLRVCCVRVSTSLPHGTSTSRCLRVQPLLDALAPLRSEIAKEWRYSSSPEHTTRWCRRCCAGPWAAAVVYRHALDNRNPLADRLWGARLIQSVLAFTGAPELGGVVFGLQ